MIRIFAFCFALCCPVLAQTGQAPIVGDPPNNVSLPNIIQSFAAKEKEYKQARDQYAYTQEVTSELAAGVHRAWGGITFIRA